MKKSDHKNIHVFEGNAESIPIGSESLDVVTSNGVLYMPVSETIDFMDSRIISVWLFVINHSGSEMWNGGYRIASSRYTRSMVVCNLRIIIGRCFY